MPIWLGVLIYIIIFAICLAVVINTNRKYIRADKQWRKWETEYWLLRTRVEDDYDIHLSFTPRGENDCIKKRKEK